MKSKNTNIILAILATSLTHAATYQWRGATSTNWTTGTNWASGSTNGQTITAGPAPTNGTFAHRLNINNQANNEAVYTAAQGTTVYANGAGRGLVIASGAAGSGGGSGTLRITGGSFSTVGTTGGDIVGNNAGNVGTLIIDGGDYIAGSTLNLGIGGGPTSNLTINSGNATVPTLNIDTTTANINLNGGTLAANTITRTSGTATITFNGGTLKARQNSATFLADLATTTAAIKSGGAIINSNGFNITIAEPLIEDITSVGGGLTKNGGGILTLTGTKTYTGETIVNAGKLILPTSTTTLAKTTIASGAAIGLSANTTGITTPELVCNGGAIDLNLGVFSPSNPAPIIATALTANSNTVINLSGSSIPVGTYTLIDYGSITGSGTFSLGTLPSNMAATINDTGSVIEMVVTSPSSTSFTWSAGTGSWDTTSLNWNANAAAYVEPALVTFPTAAAGTVTLTADRSPLSLTIDSTAAYIFQGPGLITGATTITKSGTGLATFTAANSYTGNVTITAGAIIKEIADTTSGNISVASNSSIALTNNISDGAGQTITLAGPGLTVANGPFAAVQRGSLQSLSGSNTWAGNAVFGSTTNTRIGVQDNASLTISGNITQSVLGSTLGFRHGNTAGSNITLSGTGNDWTGATQIYGGGGAVILGANNALPTSALLQVGVNGIGGTSTFDLNGFNQSVAGLNRIFEDPANAAHVTNNGAADSTLTLNPLVDRGFSGIIKDGTTNKINLAIGGPAVQQLSGVNTYTGSTVVTAGTLRLAATGEINGTSSISVNGSTASFVNNSTAILTPAVTVTSGSIDGIGTFTNVTVADSGTNTVNHGSGTTTSLVFDNLTFQGDAKINTRANILSGIDVNGTLTTTGASGAVTIDILQAPIFAVGDEIPLIDYNAFAGSLADFSLGTVTGLSVRQTASLIDTGTAIALKISGQDVRWTGAQSGTWSTTPIAGSFNWRQMPANTGTEFLTNDTVTLGDDATGTTNVVINDATVTPASVVFDNSVLDYTLSGTNGIATGKLTKTGTKKLTISTANLYDGTTSLSGGVTLIQNNAALGSAVGNTTVATDAALQLTGGLTLTENIVINGTGESTDGAIRSLAGNNTLSGTLALGSNNTTIATDSDSLLVDNAAGITGTGFSLTVSGAGNTTVTTGIKTGTGAGLTKTGSGTLALNGPSTFTGNTVVSGGTLLFNTGATYATTSIQIDSGSVLQFNNDAALSPGNTTFSGAGTLRKSGTNTISWGTPVATFNLSSGALIDVQNGIFTGGSTNNEVWTNNLSDLHVASGATFNGVEANVVVDVITGSGTISSGFNIASYISGVGFTIGADNGNGTFDGIIVNGSFPGKIFKKGSGIQKLTGANTYTGTTTIDAGKLIINGNQATATGAVSISAAGTLGGIGTLGGAVTNSGTIAPGDAGIGTLTTGATTSAAGAQWAVEYNATTADKLTVNGNLDLTNTVLNLTELATPTAPSYIIAQCTGTLSGSFANSPIVPSGYAIVIDTAAKQVRLEVASAYASWASDKGLTAANNAVTANPDGDSDINLAEFAFDGHPLSGSDNAKHFSFIQDSDADGDTDKELVLTIAVRSGAPAFTGSPLTSTVDGITYTIEGSTDLTTFNATVTPVPTAITAGLPTPRSGYQYRSFSLGGSNNLPNKGFLRGKVTQ